MRNQLACRGRICNALNGGWAAHAIVAVVISVSFGVAALFSRANTRASDLLHPDLWPSFLSRLVRVQANTVRLDVHLLTAIGRTVAQAFSSAAAAATAAAEDSSASFALFPTLQQLVGLLLPCESTPVASSWVSTFHPNYELLSAFVHGLLRQLLPQTQTGVATQTTAQVDVAALPSSVWQLLSSVLGAMLKG